MSDVGQALLVAAWFGMSASLVQWPRGRNPNWTRELQINGFVYVDWLITRKHCRRSTGERRSAGAQRSGGRRDRLRAGATCCVDPARAERRVRRLRPDHRAIARSPVAATAPRPGESAAACQILLAARDLVRYNPPRGVVLRPRFGSRRHSRRGRSRPRPVPRPEEVHYSTCSSPKSGKGNVGGTADR